MAMKIFMGFMLMVTFGIILECANGQQSGPFNYAKKTMGEREGDLTPSAIAGVSIACVGFVAAFVVTVFFCYYVYRQQKQHESLNGSFAPAAKI